MYKTRSQGFTLIELLVVIAIIGILSAVVLASLGTARNKAKDASVQTSLSGLRAAAEIYYSSNSNYGVAATACNAASTMFVDTGSNAKGLLDSINTIINGSGTAYTDMTCVIGASGATWTVTAKLPSNPATNPYFCVDSTGAARGISALPATTVTACPAS